MSNICFWKSYIQNEYMMNQYIMNQDYYVNNMNIDGENEWWKLNYALSLVFFIVL